MNVQLDTIAEKKKAIFKSTLDLIGDNGFHGCPMSMVAKNANVAAGTIYHYFDSKDSLILELYQYLIKQINSVIFENDDEKLPYKKRFFNIWTNFYNYYINNPNSLTFIEQFIGSPYSKHCSGPKITHNQLIIDFFSYGIANGYLKNLEDYVLAPVFHGTIVSAAKLHTAGRYQFSKEALQDLAGVVWDGIKKDP